MITYQYKPKGYERPTGDYLPVEHELESKKSQEYIPIPNVGDFVELISINKEETEGFKDFYNRDYKVIHRTFRYMKGICIVIITLTDIEENEDSFYRYRD
jgi:hypothetical protein